MTPSSQLIAFLKLAEGFSARIYPDAGGFSIGYGCFLMPAQVEQYKDACLTEQQATDLMMERVEPIAEKVTAWVRMPLSQNQFDALVSFAYNVGLGNFSKSTLLSLLNARDYTGAAAEFPKWNHSQGKILEALTERRKKEAAIFNGETVEGYNA